MMVRLSDVVDKISNNEDRFTTELKYYLAGEHYESERIAIYNKGIISEDLNILGFKFHFRFKAGDTIFMSRNPHLKKAGLVTYEGICSDTSYILRTKDEAVLLERFLPLVLQNERFWRWFEENKSGSVNYLLNWKTLKEYEFELPPIEEQKRIVDLAWAIERTRVAYERLISVTDELVKSQFIEMFGNPISNRMRWNTRAIGELFTIISRGKQPVYCEASNIRVINQACVYWDKFNLNNVKYHDPTSKKKTLPVRSGCILINSTGTGTLGRCNVFPEMNDDYTYVIDSHVTMLDGCELINPFFMKCLFQREDVQEKIYAEYVNGSTNQVELSKEKFSEMRIILPPIELQEQFAAFVRQTDKSKFELTQALEALNAAYKKLISENLG